jgi:hypothetical protein
LAGPEPRELPETENLSIYFGPLAVEQPYPAIADQAIIAPDAVDWTTQSSVQSKPDHLIEPLDDVAHSAHADHLVARRPEPRSNIVVEDLAQPRPSAEPSYEPYQPEPYGWETPTALLAWLELLTAECQTTQWATETSTLIEQLRRDASPGQASWQETLRLLTEQVARGEQSANQIHDPAVAADMRRGLHALTRRLSVWRALRPMPLGTENLAAQSAALEQFSLCLSDVDALMNRSATGADWRQFLLWEQLHSVPSSPASTAQIAAEVLNRLDRAIRRDEQKAFLTQGVMARLHESLRHLAQPSDDPGQLIQQIERFEQSRFASDARLLAQTRQAMAWSDAPENRALADEIEANYRGSNLRINVTEELLNRIADQPQPISGFVNEVIAGVPTRGRNHTTSNLQIDLIPDTDRARIALLANGKVAARTWSGKGPGRVSNDSRAQFTAQQLLELTPNGIHPLPPAASASSRAALRSIESDFDGVPFLGGVVRSLIRDMYEERRFLARRETENKVVNEVEAELSRQATEKTREFNQQLQSRVLDPLARLGLDPLAVSTSTTNDRLTLRVRIADERQLAAYTPRPRAPSNSLASLQVHESAVNNVLERLGLDGRTFTLAELHAWVTGRLGITSVADPDSMPDNVTVSFAPQNALHVDFQNGQLRLQLRLAEIHRAPDRWRNMTVTVHYRPVLGDPHGRLERDGVVQLAGQRLNAKGQVGLRGIFSKIFSKNRVIELIPAQIASDPRLAGVEVSQFLVRDGWVGVALAAPQTHQSRPLPAAESDSASRRRFFWAR